MADLTLIFYTLKKPPGRWREFHLKALKEAAGDNPIITLDDQPEPHDMNNIYRQIFIGCQLAETPYVALVEDDVLYSKDHFAFRPPMDTVGFNLSRWQMFTWGEPFYFLKQWSANCNTIAPRDLMIEALEERFKKYPTLPRTCAVGTWTEKVLGLTRRKSKRFYTLNPIVQLHHIESHNPKERHKKPKQIRAYDIPYWGRASELRKQWPA